MSIPSPRPSNTPSDPGRPVAILIDPRLQARWRRWAWYGVALAVAFWIAYLVREIWMPLTIAFIIAMVLDPVVDRMEKRGWSRLAATFVIFLGFFAVVGTVLYFAVPAVVDQAQRISAQVGTYIPTPGNESKARKSIQSALRRAKTPPYVQSAVMRGVEQMSAAFTRSTNWLAAHAMEVLSNLFWLVIIPIVTFYALKDFHLIFAKALLLVPAPRREFVQTIVGEVTTVFAKFLRGLVLVSFLNGVATWALLLVLRLPNAFTIGAIAGLLYSVPYFGAMLTIVLVAGVAFLTHGLNYMLIVVAANVVLHQLLFDQIITPRILGGHVGLHPLWSIVALLAGNVLLGILGMLLAVPVAASIQIIIISLVPKLNQEVELPAAQAHPAADEELFDAAREHREATSPTEELHRSVSQAVENIEAQIEQESPKVVRVKPADPAAVQKPASG